MNSLSPATPVHFLLVDDLGENLLALEGLLRRKGLNLLKAKSGPEALELLLQYDIALALIDVQMPGMDGFELAELMRGTERTRRVPIIFLTAGSADRQRRFRGYEAGAVDFLHKPLEPDILRSKAEVFFELHRQRQEVAAQRDELKAATEEISRLLAESRAQAAALREADHRKDVFLAMLAHELRNPLAPIQNAVEILRQLDAVPTEAKSAREIIARQVTHMSRLIDDLLDMARISRGTVELQLEPCDLGKIARQTAEDFRSVLEAAHLALQIKIPEQPIWISGDRVRLAQIIGNLLHNASKFTPAGGQVTVTAQVQHADQQALVSIEDTGTGLDMSAIERLFEPFGQGNQSIDRAKGGLGLGLALVKGLTDLHRGAITANSPGKNRGSTFTLKFPLAQPPAFVPPPAQDIHAKFDRPLKILIVEDNQDAAQTLRLLLKLLKHDAEMASDAQTALDHALAHPPDVILSDIGLPGDIDGYELARRIRANPTLSHLHLIALSGYGQEEDRQQSRRAGFDQHLIKPTDLEKLRTALAQLAAD